MSIPIMNTNLDALLRSHIPLEMQGRVYSVRSTLQFFTIPVGSLLGGVLADRPVSGKAVIKKARA